MSSRNEKIIPFSPSLNGDRLLTRKEAAAYLRTSVRWLEGQRAIPALNIAAPNSRRAMIRYRQSDLDRHFESRSNPSADVGGR